MISAQPLAPAAQDIRQALDRMKARHPDAGEILSAFGPLAEAQATVKSGLPPLDEPLPAVDAARLARGIPLAGVEDFLACRGLDLPRYLERSVREIVPALRRGLPGLAADLDLFSKALADNALDAPACLEAFLCGQQDNFQGQAEKAGLAPAFLSFVLIQLTKPLLQRRAHAMAVLLKDQLREEGSCPVCGSLPEMAFLQGDGGRRWLRCSLCAHHWLFKRTACPVCGNEDQDTLEFLYAKGRERERADCCGKCKKYVVTLDTRGLDEKPLWDVAALGLVYLDILAQKRGLAPAAWCAWNQVG